MSSPRLASCCSDSSDVPGETVAALAFGTSDGRAADGADPPVRSGTQNDGHARSACSSPWTTCNGSTTCPWLCCTTCSAAANMSRHPLAVVIASRRSPVATTSGGLPPFRPRRTPASRRSNSVPSTASPVFGWPRGRATTRRGTGRRRCGKPRPGHRSGSSCWPRATTRKPTSSAWSPIGSVGLGGCGGGALGARGCSTADDRRRPCQYPGVATLPSRANLHQSSSVTDSCTERSPRSQLLTI